MKQLYGKVNNPSGLTSRLSAELVAEANRTSCKVTLYSHDDEADLKSIMNMMALVIRHDEEFKIVIEGDTEEAVAKKFKKLLEQLNLLK